jgi:hypothetical protein
VRTHPVDKLSEQHCYKSAAGLLQLVVFTRVNKIIDDQESHCSKTFTARTSFAAISGVGAILRCWREISSPLHNIATSYMTHGTALRNRFYLVARQHIVPDIELTQFSSITKVHLAIVEMPNRKRPVENNFFIFEVRGTRRVRSQCTININVHVPTTAVPRGTHVMPFVIMDRRYSSFVSL